MSYFSRVHLDPRGLDRKALVAVLAGDAYLDHSLIWRLFRGDDVNRDFIFRSERDETGKPVYYIVSQRMPESIAGLLMADTKVYAPRLEVDDKLSFSLRANPTVAIGEAGKKHSRRHDVLMHAKLKAVRDGESDTATAMDAAALGWLTQRAADWGVEIASASVLIERYEQHNLRHKGRNIEFSSVDYRGLAKVVDAAKLLHALNHGVGRSKGFGCGLLLIKRLG